MDNENEKFEQILLVLDRIAVALETIEIRLNALADCVEPERIINTATGQIKVQTQLRVYAK